MDISSKREAFIARCVGKLARSAGFHPVELSFPELTPYCQLAEHVLVRQLPDGYWQMMMLVGCDSPHELAEAARHVVNFAENHPELTSRIHLRVSCVGIGPGELSRSTCRRLLEPVRMQQRHVVVRRFWLSLDRRRMFAFYSPWTFAPGFEINPCDPDDNVFVLLVRKDRYLKEDVGPAPTEDFHRLSLTKERTFVSGLLGRKVLVRTLLVFTVLVWLGLEFSGGSTQPVQLIRAGAKSAGLIRAGQYWRLVTPIFLHFGLFHLVVNVLALLLLGEVLERIYGTMRFALLYFVSGIVSVVTSFIFGHELMVGASGAIFGLAGALVVYGFRYRSRIPRRYGAMFGGGLLPLIGLNILFGIFIKGIDNSAHLGGLVAGTTVALLLKPLADEVTPPSWTSLRRLVTLVVLGVVLGSLLVAGVSFIRYHDIFKTDARWMLRHETPGGLTVFVPGSWVETVHGEREQAFQSVCYHGRLDIRALDAREFPTQVFFGEVRRLNEAGLFFPDQTPEVVVWHHNELRRRGRVQARMISRKYRQREQVFLMIGDELVSVGVEILEKDAARFAPILDRMLATLPEPQKSY